MRYALGSLLMAVCMLSLSAQAQTRVETLRWTHPGTRDGFKVYTGAASSEYGPPLNIGLPLPDAEGIYQYDLDVPADSNPFVAVTAYNAVGESVYSNEQQRCSSDGDEDGVCTATDNCKTESNHSQFDANGDGFGNVCDTDWDDNGKTGISDLGIWRQHFGHTNDDPMDAVIDTSEPPDGGVGIVELGTWARWFGWEPGP